MFPFKHDEIEVTACVAVWIVPADLRTPFVNRAAPFTLIEEHAHRFINGIFAVSQHAHGFAFVRHLFGEFVARRVHRNSVMLRQSGDVARLGFNVVVATAIAGALAAIKRVLGNHMALISKNFVAMLMDYRHAVIIV